MKEIKHVVLIYWPSEMKFFVKAIGELLKKNKNPVSFSSSIRVNDADEARKLIVEGKFSPQDVVFVSGVDEKVGERGRRSLKNKFPEARFFRFSAGTIKEE